MGGNPNRTKFWELLVMKNIEQRPSMWKFKSLSIANRVQLIKYVLLNLPIHFLSIFRYQIVWLRG